MMKHQITEVMMERVFKSVDADGTIEEITLQIGKPYSLTDSNSSLKWRCPFQITGIGSEQIQEGPGMDAVDALLITLKLTEVFLSSYGRTYKKKISWLDENHLGLSTLSVTEKSKSLPESEGSVFDRLINDFFRNIS